MVNDAPVSEFLTHIDVSRETIDQLHRFEALLKKWNPVINLVSKSTLERVWQRHFLDSAQLLDLAPPQAETWADFGSGGGFPGLVIAVLAAELRPELKVTLVESDARKTAFLLSASQALGISVKIHAERVEKLAPLAADIITARALAPLMDLIGLSHRHLAQNGICIFPKGENHSIELTEAQKYWTFSHKNKGSVTDQSSSILIIGDIKRV